MVRTGKFPWRSWWLNWALLCQIEEVERGRKMIQGSRCSCVKFHLTWYAWILVFKSYTACFGLCSMARLYFSESSITFFWLTKYTEFPFIFVAVYFVLYCKLTKSLIENIVCNWIYETISYFLLAEKWSLPYDQLIFIHSGPIHSFMYSFIIHSLNKYASSTSYVPAPF